MVRLRSETSLFHVLWRTWKRDNDFLFLFLILCTVLWNSTSLKSPPDPYIWQIERGRIAVGFRWSLRCRRRCSCFKKYYIDQSKVFVTVPSSLMELLAFMQLVTEMPCNWEVGQSWQSQKLHAARAKRACSRSLHMPTWTLLWMRRERPVARNSECRSKVDVNLNLNLPFQ